jgi:hypothetical protein
MTAPNGAILFNSSTGSDTTASGLGAANVYGSGASTTGSSAVVTGIDTTGVSSGDLLWVQSSSGRQFSIIATVDSSTQVTCDDTFANTESSRTWAIGGKRATWDNADSVKIFTADAKSDWDIVTETNQTITQQIPLVNGCRSIRGSSSSSLVIITQSSNNEFFYNLHAQPVLFADMELQYSNATKNKAGIAFSGGEAVLSNIVANDSTNNLYYAFAQYCCSSANVVIQNCIFGNCVSYAVVIGQGSVVANGSVFHDNDYGVYYFGGSLTSCIFANNTNSGILVNSFGGKAAAGNLFVGNGRYGIETVGGAVPSPNKNWFYNNTLGNTNNSAMESAIDVNLTSDPFVDAASYDFNISDTGDGSILRATKFAANSATGIYPFRQYVSDDFDSGAGGGGATVHPLYAN